MTDLQILLGQLLSIWDPGVKGPSYTDMLKYLGFSFTIEGKGSWRLADSRGNTCTASAKTIHCGEERKYKIVNTSFLRSPKNRVRSFDVLEKLKVEQLHWVTLSEMKKLDLGFQLKSEDVGMTH